MLMDLHLPLAVACHDAGATNTILAWLAASNLGDVRLLVDGPASALVAQHSTSGRRCSSVEELVEGAGTLLSSSGWASTLEHDARREAQRRSVYSIAVLDHWTNYPQRFVRCGETILPDEIWVTDQYAYRIATETFPSCIVRERPNLYLEQQLQRIAPISECAMDLLYVLEPARDDWDRGVPGEFQALDYFMQRVGLLGLQSETRIVLRPHPSDPFGKYDAWIARQTRGNIAIDDDADIANAMSRASWVAGCETFALVIGLLAGRRVICTLPPWAPPCRLPHDGLVHLKTLEATA